MLKIWFLNLLLILFLKYLVNLRLFIFCFNCIVFFLLVEFIVVIFCKLVVNLLILFNCFLKIKFYKIL